MADDQARYDELRKALEEANCHHTYEAIYRLMASAGLGLSITADAFRRFGENPRARLRNANDLRNLETFLYTREAGLLLRRTAADGQAKTDCVLDRLLRNVHIRLERGEEGEREERVTGRYFGFHGAITRSRHYAVRLLTARRQDNAIVHITSKILKQRGSGSQDFYAAEGLLVYEDEHFQILMHHKNDKEQPNNLLALNLICFDRSSIEPFKGPFESSAAQMIGMTKNGDYFVRNLLVKRIRNGLNEDEAFALTGDYTHDNLPDDFRKAFAELAAHMDNEIIRDPMLDWPKP